MDEEFSKFYSECSELESTSSTAQNVASENPSTEIPIEASKNDETLSNIPMETEKTEVLPKDTGLIDGKVSGSQENKSENPRGASGKEVQSEDSQEKKIGEDDKAEYFEAEAPDVPEKKQKTAEEMKEHYAKHTRYEGTECIYTNPDNKEEFLWNKEMNQWVPKNYKPFFDGKTYRYVDAQGGIFRWNSETNAWEKPDDLCGSQYGFDGENHTYTDAKDNTVYIWDREKSAWFPKVDEDFMARYQMNYGFVDNTTKEEEPKSDEKKAEKRKPSDPSWFELDDQHNTKVYVSNLPDDLTEQEFIDFMQKCGLVLKDLKTNKFKVKLYREPNGTFKGDALCDYIKIESVELALSVLDGSELRGKRVSVQRAKFQMKGDYNPALKPKKKKKKEKEQELKVQQKLLDWRPDKLRGEREKHERTIVIKNLFDPKIFDANVELILEFTEDIRSEASKCGQVRKVTLYDKNPEGVATITFSDAEEADICKKLLHNRWFGKRRVIADTWDGKTKYKVVETAEETSQRIDNWNKFLESEDRLKK